MNHTDSPKWIWNCFRFRLSTNRWAFLIQR